MSQHEKILNSLKGGGVLTSMRAYVDLGITQLGARVFELKRQGYNINSTPVKRDGKNYNLYTLEN